MCLYLVAFLRYSTLNNSITLKSGIWGPSRSLKMAPFDRSYTTYYWTIIASIALSCTIFELFDVKWYRDLEIWISGHSISFKLVPFESLGAVAYLPCIVTMALSCIISETKRIIGWKSWFFIPLPFDAPGQLGGSPRNIAIPFGIKKN